MASLSRSTSRYILSSPKQPQLRSLPVPPRLNPEALLVLIVPPPSGHHQHLSRVQMIPVVVLQHLSPNTSASTPSVDSALLVCHFRLRIWTSVESLSLVLTFRSQAKLLDSALPLSCLRLKICMNECRNNVILLDSSLSSFVAFA